MKKTINIMAIFLVLIWTQFSYADWGHGRPGYHGNHAYFRYHDHPHFGAHVAAFYPDEYYPVWVGGARYYYDDGVYYDYINGGYVVATPPVGAVVSTIPSDFQAVVVNGVTYYTDNGVYYVYTPNGYKVVPTPARSSGVFVINVPRGSGGYVAIRIKSSGNGFLGPQGEFYSTFPSVQQLKIMYGR